MTTRSTVLIALVCLVQMVTVVATHAEHRPVAAETRPESWPAQPPTDADADLGRLTAAAANLPICFEANVGQVDDRVSFVARGSGYGLFLSPEEVTFALRYQTAAPDALGDREPLGRLGNIRSLAEPAPAELLTSVLKMRLVGASPSTPVGERMLETRTNYFRGNDPARWRTDVANFARVRYPDVYPGVDLVFYGGAGALEYDLVLAPGADPSTIEIEWEGADGCTVDEDGSVVLKVAGGELRQAAPVLYQETESGRETVAGRFETLGSGRVGLRVGAYEATAQLVVDPTLSYSTFVGGSLQDQFNAVAVDATGAAYMTGVTYSSDYPTAQPFDSTFGGGPIDAVVSKLSPAGDALVYSTYLGGALGDPAGDAGNDIAVDSSGAAYVTGITKSTDFPIVNAFDSTLALQDAFVTKLSPAGNTLNYSTYLGGTQYDAGVAIALFGSAAYVTGSTSSNDFPTTSGAFDTTYNYGNSGQYYPDVFVTCITSPSGQATLLYSTYLGGGLDDRPLDIAVKDKRAYVTGITISTDFPTVAALATSKSGYYDAFVAELNSSGTSLVFSTYLGGSEFDGGYGIAVDAPGAIYVAGITSSPDFPTVNAYDSDPNGDTDVFVTKLTPTGSALVFSTYLGGASDDILNGTAVDSSGAIYVAGTTYSPDFPTVAAYDSSLSGGSDAFVAKLNGSGTALVYSTYLGGSNYEHADGLAVDALGTAYVVGYSISSNFPTVGAYDPVGHTASGITDAFVSKLATAADVRVTMTATPGAIHQVEDLTYRISIANLGPARATGVYFTMPTPAQTVFISATTSQDVYHVYPSPGETSSVIVMVGDLAPNATATIRIVVRTKVRITGSVVGQATVTTDSEDPNTANNTATCTTPIVL